MIHIINGTAVQLNNIIDEQIENETLNMKY